ncbi:MAG: T9SS type A sorting domain-containing protein, partial [Candidatus Cloacimonadaceae bacterium]|nr:T9SS type A sorting domain-containing protein [Candidatus Cloacimonadaceae bacterium]
SYLEKEDYIPLYIELDDAEGALLPDEIGFYKDGVCKGAVKVEGAFTDLCAYLDAGEVIDPDNSELILYYASKAMPENRMLCKIKPESLNYFNDNGLRYYTLKINTATDINPVLPITALQQNYPNPFNPSTTIKFELAEEGAVSLEIYNIKGQKVKTLIDGIKVSGPHRVSWDGTDRYGRSVASGLYHYRLITKDKSISKKMLLLR